MKIFKHIILSLFALILLSTQVYAADETQINNLQTAPVTAAVIDTIFEQTNKPMQLSALSPQEMEKTEGAIAPIVVYGLVVGGRIAYVGITNNLTRRVAQHAATKTFSSVRQLGSSATRAGARVIEQNNINRYNTINNGLNRINSISPRNPLSNQVFCAVPSLT